MPWRGDKDKQRASYRAWYVRNSGKVKAKAKLRRRQVAKWYRDYKQTLACVKCGENDPVTLDFHHQDPGEKDLCITVDLSVAVRAQHVAFGNFSLDTLNATALLQQGRDCVYSENFQ